MLPVTAFVMEWVRTQASYDSLVARTMSADWASKHLPVFSHGNTHTLYKGFNTLEPDGQVVVCHRGCGIENRKWEMRPTTIRIECRRCKSQCTIERQKADTSTLLGSRGLVKVDFPVGQASTLWTFKTGKGALKGGEHPGGSKVASKKRPLESAVPTPVKDAVKGGEHQDGSKVAPKKRPLEPAVPTPGEVSKPPQPPPPPPSRSSSPEQQPLTIKVPLLSTIRNQSAARRSRRALQPNRSLSQAEPLVRSRSAPESLSHPAAGQLAQAIQSLDDLPALHVSTTSSKRRRKY